MLFGKGFGFFQSKPATAFSPVAITPDALGDAWKGTVIQHPLFPIQNIGLPWSNPPLHTGGIPADFFALLHTLFIAQRRLHTPFGIVENPLSFELGPAAVAFTLPNSIFVIRSPKTLGDTTHEPAFTADLTGRKPILNPCRILSSQLANSHEEEQDETENPKAEHACKLPHRSQQKNGPNPDFPRTDISISFLKKKQSWS